MDTATNLFLWLFGGAGLVLAGWLWKRWRSSQIRPPQMRRPSLDELKANSRILVVDDEPFDYLKALRRNDFKVSAVSDITSTREIELGEYDVVLLDLHGVGASVSAEQGVGLLRHIKEASPAQVVIAYSSASWPLAASEQVKMADIVLDKAKATYPDFRQAVEVHLLKSATFEYYRDLLLTLAPGADKDAVGEALAWFISEPDDAARLECLERVLELGSPGNPKLVWAQAVTRLAVRRLKPWIE